MPASRSDIRLVVFDVDGTIRSADDPDCLRIRPALRMLEGAGMPWTFATGRPYRSMVRATAGLFADEVRTRVATSNYNGGVVFGPGDPARLTVNLLEPEALGRALAVVTDMGMPAIVFTCEPTGGVPRESIRIAGSPSATMVIDEFLDGIPERHDPAKGHAAGVTSLIVRTHDLPTMDEITALQAAIGPSVFVSTSGYPFYEISPPGTSKGSALAALAACFDCDPAQVMAVGDGINDIEMLGAAGMGVAVGNAPDVVKRAADLVMAGHVADGATQAVMALLGSRSVDAASLVA